MRTRKQQESFPGAALIRLRCSDAVLYVYGLVVAVAQLSHGLHCYVVDMKTTMNLDDALVREAMAIHRGKTKTAVVELGLQELINAHRRRRLGATFGSQPDLRPVARRRSVGDPR